MLDNHNVRICRLDRFRVVVILCPTKVIKIVELCKGKRRKVTGNIVTLPFTHTPHSVLFFNNNIYIIYIYYYYTIGVGIPPSKR